MAENENETPNEEAAELETSEEVNLEEVAEEELAMPAHLGTELGDEGSLDEEDASVDEAMRAWVAGGRVIEEDDDAVLPVQFAQLEPPVEPPKEPTNERLNNVNVNVTVELGRKEMTVQELVNMKEQDVIDLAKLAGEAFDIRVNNRLFAEGEIVVVTDLMAVRITRLRPSTADQASAE